MSIIRLYIDEDSQDYALLRALRARHIDVITVKETNTEGLLDIEQLRLAATNNGCFTVIILVTFASFILNLLKAENFTRELPCSIQEHSIGEQVRAILEFIANKTAEDMENQLDFLSKYIKA